MRLVGSSFMAVILIFVSNSVSIALETKVVQPSLFKLGENFRSEKDTFKEQAKAAIQEFEKISSDDAVLASFRLQKNLRTVEMLDCLITECKDESRNPPIKQNRETNACIQEICRYLAGVMPYAGKMQDVISSVLRKEFGVNSISELELMAKE